MSRMNMTHSYMCRDSISESEERVYRHPSLAALSRASDYGSLLQKSPIKEAIF